MILHVRLFARARDLAGAERVDIDLPAGGTVADLRRSMAQRCPALASLLTHSAFAVNNEFASDGLAVPGDAEIALLPPVSGG